MKTTKMLNDGFAVVEGKKGDETERSNMIPSRRNELRSQSEMRILSDIEMNDYSQTNKKQLFSRILIL